MKREKLIWGLGFCGILLFAGCQCSSVGYFSDACTLPEESRADSCFEWDFGRRARYPLACMNMTVNDFRFAGKLWKEAPGFSILFWPFIALDIPFSLCGDVVSMPWQTARYQDFPDDDPIDPQMGRRLYRGEAVPEVLRALRGTQAVDGRWTGGKSVLADTALVALALTWHGEWSASTSEEGDKWFRPMLVRATDYVVSCVDLSKGGVRLLGEDADTRAFPIAACALTEIGGLTRRPNIRAFLPAIQARLAKELAQEKDLVLTPLVAERLGWMVLALESGLADGCAPARTQALLDAVRPRLADYEPLKGSYYDMRQLYRVACVKGGRDTACLAFSGRMKENRRRLEKSGSYVKVVRGVDGRPHWQCCVYDNGPNAKNGLGLVADSALGVLQVSFPAPHRVPVKRPQGDGQTTEPSAKEVTL